MIVIATFVAHTRLQIIVKGIHKMKLLAQRFVGFIGTGGKVDEVEALDLVRNALVNVRCDRIRKYSLALPALVRKDKAMRRRVTRLFSFWTRKTQGLSTAG